MNIAKTSFKPLLTTLSLLTLAIAPACGESDSAADTSDGATGEYDSETGDESGTDPGDDGSDGSDSSDDGADGDSGESSGDGNGDGDGDTGDLDTTGTSGDGDGDGADTTAPEILSVTPGDQDVGVHPDATIEIEFSEPMDKASVQLAWQSADLPPSSVTFAWNDEGTMVTVTPNDALEVLEAADSETGAAYQFAITTVAVDLAGNELPSESNVEFAVARRSFESLDVDPVMTAAVRNTNLVDSINQHVQVGDYSTDDYAHGFVSFDLEEGLPAGVVAIETAAFRVEDTTTSGTPFSLSTLGALRLRDFSYDSPGSEAMASQDAVDLGSILYVLEPNQGELDVSEQLVADLEEGATYAQFRLSFDTDTDQDGGADHVTIKDEDMHLELSALIP